MAELLVCVDLSQSDVHLLEVARGLADRLGTGLVLLHVTHPDPDFAGLEAGSLPLRKQWADWFRERHKELMELAGSQEDMGIRAEALLVQGDAVETILKHADSLQSELILMGTHGHGKVYDLLVGSVAQGVLRKSRRPVLLVPAVRDK